MLTKFSKSLNASMKSDNFLFRLNKIKDDIEYLYDNLDEIDFDSLTEKQLTDLYELGINTRSVGDAIARAADTQLYIRY